MPGQDDDHQARPTDGNEAIDPELSHRVAALIRGLCGGESERAASEASLLALGAPALERLLFTMMDAHLSPATRACAGTLAGRIGDPRLSDPEAIGPFVRVTSGVFRMGAKPFEPDAETNAVPQHDVDLPSFAIARYPVTNLAFSRFVQAGGYEDERWWTQEGWQWCTTAAARAPQYWRSAPERPSHPVAGVCWFEALAYARWLNAALDERGDVRPGEEVRLPSEAEWEKAARGGVTLDRRRAQPNNMPERRFPWGDAYVANIANTAECGLNATTPVGMFPEASSPYKIDDLGGNVLEWCTSRPGAYPYHGGDGREAMSGGPRTFRTARGGAWGLGADAARCAYRHWNRVDFRGPTMGFRVVMGHPLT